MPSLTSGAIGFGLDLAAIASATAQQPTSAKSPPDAHPDLQGIWVNNTVTPFERPPELAGKEFFTNGELAVLKQRAARLFSGDGDDLAPGDALFLALLRACNKTPFF